MNNFNSGWHAMYEAIYTFPEQLEEALVIGKNLSVDNKYTSIKNIVFVGMGGSAIGGDAVNTLIQDEISIPFIVNRNYKIPNWANSSTLVICSSYSGNTEETLSAYSAALKQGCLVCGITTGGRLLQLLKSNRQDAIEIPGGYQPRAAIGLSFVPVLYFLHKIGIISNRLLTDVSDSVNYLKNIRERYTESIGSNPAYQLAQELYQTLPVIIGTANYSEMIARRWKGQFCENAKMLAYHNELPEMNHNEIEGWENNPDIIRKCTILWIEDESDIDRNIIRQKISNEVLAGLNIKQQVVTVDGTNPVTRFIHLIYFGDWISLWCAHLHRTNPTPVDKIRQLKTALENYQDSEIV